MRDTTFKQEEEQKSLILEQKNLIEKDLEEQFGKKLKQQVRSWSPKRFKKSELPVHIKRDPFLWRIYKRLHYEDKNVLIIVVGETGIGKSCSALNLAWKIDVTPVGDEKFIRNFKVECDKNGKPSPETRVVFSASDFMRLVRSSLPKGSILVWDEAGIGNDNTSWYDKKSKLVKHVMQTFRKQNLGLILTVPDEESVTLATRRLIHIIIDIYERNNGYVLCDVRWIQRNRKMKKDYKKCTAYFDENTGYNSKLTSYWIEKLPSKLEIPYNKIKDRVLDNLYDFYEQEMKEMDQIEGFEIQENYEDEDSELRKFDVVKCVDLCQDNRDKIVDSEDSPNKDKIIYFLGLKGFVCNTANARTIIANVD